MKLTPIKYSAFTLVCLIGLTAYGNLNAAEDSGEAIDLENTTEKAGVRVVDATTTTKVKSAFLAEDTLKNLDIYVSTTRGVVILAGVVDSVKISQKALEVASEISEVKHVNNQLVIK